MPTINPKKSLKQNLAAFGYQCVHPIFFPGTGMLYVRDGRVVTQKRADAGWRWLERLARRVRRELPATGYREPRNQTGTNGKARAWKARALGGFNSRPGPVVGSSGRIGASSGGS